MVKWHGERGNFNIKTLRQFESENKVRFPDEYIQLVSEHNGAKPRPNCFDINGKRGLVFARLLNWDSKRENDIVSVHSWFLHEVERNDIVPVAIDPFGNYICLSFAKRGSPIVVVWFHETGNIVSTKKNFARFIESFYDAE